MVHETMCAARLHRVGDPLAVDCAERQPPMTSVQGTAVDIPTEDGIADAYLSHPADGGPRPAVLLYMDAFGLRPRLEQMADRLDHVLDAVVDSGECGTEPTTVIDFSGGEAEIVRVGAGDVSRFE